MTLDPTQRFSTRVANYINYRPSYPSEVLSALAAECGLQPSWIVADIGSGTGLFCALLLQNGNVVFGVEPNAEMRAAGERLLADYPGFHSVAGRAEATTLAAASVDLVTAGQAFHWFDAEAARVEFRRILKAGGWVALIWNERQTDSTPFMRDYEALLRDHAPDYAYVTHRELGESDLAAFFRPMPMSVHRFANRQTFDWDGLAGRVLSSSYVPEPGRPGHEALMKRLGELYQTHAEAGLVSFDYETTLYCGRLEEPPAR